MLKKIFEVLIRCCPVLGLVCSVAHDGRLERPPRNNALLGRSSPARGISKNRWGKQWANGPLEVAHPLVVTAPTGGSRCKSENVAVRLAPPVFSRKCEATPRRSKDVGQPLGKYVFVAGSRLAAEQASARFRHVVEPNAVFRQTLLVGRDDEDANHPDSNQAYERPAGIDVVRNQRSRNQDPDERARHERAPSVESPVLLLEQPHVEPQSLGRQGARNLPVKHPHHRGHRRHPA